MQLKLTCLLAFFTCTTFLNAQDLKLGLPLGHTSSIRSAQFSPDGSLVITGSYDNSARIWDVQSGQLLHSLEGHTDYVTSAQFSPDGSQVVIASDDYTARIWEAQSGRLLHALEGHTSRVRSAQFSPDGNHVVTASSDKTARIWEAQSGRLLHSLEGHTSVVYSAQFSPDGKHVVTASWDNTARIWDSQSGQLLHTLEGHTSNVNSALFSPDGSQVVTASDDATARIWDVKSGKLLQTLEGHTSNVTSAQFSPDGRQVVTSSDDGSTILWDVATGEQLMQHFIFDGDPNKWVHLHPSGLFDASPEGMQLMYWTKGLDVIAFDQLKDRYWEPGLWQKVMAGETLRNTRGLNELKLEPSVDFGVLDNGVLPITLTKRDGGYGQVSILINGKEVALDARGDDLDTTLSQYTFYYPIKNHPFLVDGDNNISVVASSADGFVRGRERTVTINYAGVADSTHQPHFYGVVIGVSQYANTTMNLTFPQYDARAIDSAVTMGAHNLFGKERTHLYNLTTESATLPTKDNIKAVFEDISQKAHPEDVIFLYLSGHGITWGGDMGDFFFLTSDAISATSNAYNDPVIRERVAISTQEWVEWFTAIPALKQVMVIDACGAGKAVDNLLAARDIEASQLKAIDRMKDRTGMFILSGCAADASAYEASVYGQGLLTYTVLEAMKGAAIEPDGSVDIIQLMSHARERVPELAREIGGIQQPQVLVPRGGSIDIGILSEKDRQAIPLNTAKTVFVRSTFIDSEEAYDALGLMRLVDEQLLTMNSRGNASSIVFFDAGTFPDACRLSGNYTQTNNTITLPLKIRCGELTQTITLSADTPEELVNKIVEGVLE